MRATYVVAGIATAIAVLFAAALAPLFLSGVISFHPRESANTYKPGAILNRQLTPTSTTGTISDFPGLIIGRNPALTH